MAHTFEFIFYCGIKDIVMRICKILIKLCFIGICSNGGVICTFHSAFYFETVDSRSNKFGNVLYHTHILGAENKCAAVVFKGGQMHFGTFDFVNIGMEPVPVIFPSARLCAGTVIGISAHKKV